RVRKSQLVCGGCAFMRSTPNFLLLLLIILCLSVSSLAQQRDPAAILALQQAITAMNANLLLAQTTSALCIGSIQGIQGSGVQSGTFTWEHQFSASGFQFRSEFQNSTRNNIFVFDGTTASSSNNGSIATIRSYMAQGLAPVHLPAVVLNMFLANTNYA